MGGYRGRLIPESERAQAIELINEACISGARKSKTCEILQISPKTVESYIADLKAKLRCQTKDELIKFANESHLALLLIKVYESLN